jgi:hypothetical protein
VNILPTAIDYSNAKMALPAIDRETFLNFARPAVERAAACVDWTALLTAYTWGGADWRAGLQARASMHERLVRAHSDEQRSGALAEIVAWGALPALSADAVRRVLASLSLLDAPEASTDAPSRDLYARRIPAVSKIYAMYSPSQWVIYDSRVARGLALLAIRFAEGATATVMRFPQPPGRTGGRPRGFPTLGSERQGRLAFTYASWFAREVASRISARCPDPDGWDARHVEMALFMLGNPAGPPPSTVRVCGLHAIVDSIERRLDELSTERMRLEAARRVLVG